MLVRPQLESLDDTIQDVSLHGVKYVACAPTEAYYFIVDIHMVGDTRHNHKELVVAIVGRKRSSGEHELVFRRELSKKLHPKDIPSIPLHSNLLMHGEGGVLYGLTIINALCARVAKLIVTASLTGTYFRLKIGDYEDEFLATDDAVKHILVRT